jgi:tRNASer (uridine44-2'-O)-methyltransferase
MPGRRNDPREWTPVSLIDSGSDGREWGRLPRTWQYIVCNPATYPPEIFAQVAIQLIHHPERNSKNIRRADIVSDTDEEIEAQTDCVEKVDGMACVRSIRRRLLPRNPNLDPELEQTCRLYAVEAGKWPTLMTYYCHYDDAVGLPYYVPDVLGIAFELYKENIYLAYLPLPGKSATEERLQRVAINLLRTIHRHW